MKKIVMDYWVDLVTGGAFVCSTMSGLVFLLPGDAATQILGISYQVWSNVHTWSSLVLIAGVGAHLALHWKWMVSMTQRMLWPTGRRKAPKAAPESALAGAEGTTMSRRTFLALGGMTAAAACLVVAGKAVLGAIATDDSSITQVSKVACPRGLVNDPYPGRCRHYVDADGDGYCDYSVSS